MGAHILFDSTVVQSMPLCGICLRPLPQCQFFLKKGKGPNTSSIAAESTPLSQCSNVPIQCPLCPKSDPTIWKYFLKIHFQDKHKNASLPTYKHLWKLSNFEIS
ncbi:hypothetical protein B0H34DRAFT_734161 [Crassisporium funariophilum]|nr:hypothetical protein B0H34DRAFT_734161 [Crassisporium funariophilum]